MSIDHILQRYTSTAAMPDAVNTVDTESVDDLGGYGLLRGQRERSVSLELRRKDDSVLAIPYAFIEQFVYSPADGITLRAAGREIRIRGRNLNELTTKPLALFSALARHRVPWIAEQSRGSRPAAADATVIEAITW